jgi:hypothetical protein
LRVLRIDFRFAVDVIADEDDEDYASSGSASSADFSGVGSAPAGEPADVEAVE